ncbi:MAG: hypothetical protein GXP08_16700 [Gammaproteobacteria bacterium]|nr:hypothetical protein [Gammaproteobacteria bacterium]
MYQKCTKILRVGTFLSQNNFFYQHFFHSNVIRLLLILFSSVVLAACQSTGANSNASNKAEDREVGVLMVYSEREAGGPLFRSRVFVSDNYVYMDDTRVPEDFLLFNRKEQKIYTVNSGEKSIFVIAAKAITVQPPIEINYTEESQPSSAIPKVNGGKATHYRYDVNGKRCYDAVTMESSFLPEVIGAFKEFRTVLAGEHASSLSRMPADTHDACGLALNIFYSTKHLEHGVPLREWDQRGFLKFMVDYAEGFKMKLERLQLPSEYRQYSVSG